VLFKLKLISHKIFIQVSNGDLYMDIRYIHRALAVLGYDSANKTISVPKKLDVKSLCI